MKNLLFVVATALLFSVSSAQPQGTVYLVLGSDTGIWDGMDVARYRCTYSGISCRTDGFLWHSR
jgi:hypothetical protein